MSKELVISAASHERRVAILEEGQLVEIYIEREKEFALVGSIYKGRVTRVLPGMQSAFVDIGLDGDAFLYVSDVFENLEDYDHGHGHGPAAIPVAPALAEALPGETLSLAHAGEEIAHEHESLPGEVHGSSAPHDDQHHEEHEHAAHMPDASHDQEDEHASPRHEHHAAGETHEHSDALGEPAEDRQPESNASAPQNFGHQYNPTQKYAPR